MAVRALGKSDQEFTDDAFTKQFVKDKLTHFTETLAEINDPRSNTILTRGEVLQVINNWLETLCELDELTCTGPGCSLCVKGKM